MRLKLKVRSAVVYLDGAEWGPHRWYYFYWWNWLPKHLRYWGYEVDWYDGPIYSFGFWFINWSWSFPLWIRIFGSETTKP